MIRFDENKEEIAQPVPFRTSFNTNRYLTAPPDALISLESLKALLEKNCGCRNPDTSIEADLWIETENPQKGNFISAMRVRLAGIPFMDEAAEDRSNRKALSSLSDLF